MEYTLRLGEVVWHDLLSPSDAVIEALVARYHLPAEVGEELRLPSPRGMMRAWPEEGIAYVVLPFPTIRRLRDTTETELDLVVGSRFVISVHYTHLDPLHKLQKELESWYVARGGTLSSGFTLSRLILKKLYSSVLHDLEALRSDLEEVERTLFQGNNKELLEHLAQVGHDILNVRQAIEPHQFLWEEWQTEIAPRFSSSEVARLTEVARRESRQVIQLSRLFASWIDELRETILAVVTTRQNEIMKNLTIMAFVTFPLTLVSSIFGMNTTVLPIVGMPHDFWIIVGIMVMMTIGFFWYFHRKGWLS